ncbi:MULTISPECIES: YbdD/YjiX family protein [Gordonia]|uniref:YbdD/YjiX family protein n=1 Tax=Gordonia TaxID=2053 RepID=UPI0032B60B73
MTGAQVIASLRRAGGQVAWYVGSVMGDRDYQRYLDHHAAHRADGDDRPPMTEREYWRARWDHTEKNPQGRCC